VIVAQVCCGERLVLEALQLPGVDGRREWEHLQRYPAPKRNLLGLVDDSHPTPTDLTQEAKVAQLSNVCRLLGSEHLAVAEARSPDGGISPGTLPTRLAERGSDALHLIVAGEERLQFSMEVRVRRQQLALVQRLSRLKRLHIAQQNLVEPSVTAGVVHEV